MSVASALKRYNLGVLCCRQVAHHLQPLLLATDELEKDSARLDQVLSVLLRLYGAFSSISNSVARNVLIDSLEVCFCGAFPATLIA